MNLTKAQIAEYKKKHGEIYEISVDVKSCIVRKPNRKDLSYVSVVKDPIKMSEALLKQLWVDGDKEILENDDLFLAVIPKMEEVIKVKESEIKKL
jgi:L-rhamnose mutarotase